jgi:hypothetical protein
MKRWIVVCSLAVLMVLGALAPAGAQAAAVTAAKLTSGKPVKVTIAKPGVQSSYTFAATAGKNVTFQVTLFRLTDTQGAAEFTLDFYEPHTTSPYTQASFETNGHFNFSPPVGGTWKATLVPYSDTVGSLTLTFANDVPTKALASGTPFVTTLKFAGQQAQYTFAATAGKNVTFQVTHFDFTDSAGAAEVTLDFYEPHTTSPYTQASFEAGGHFNFSPPQSGTWQVLLVPYAETVGSLTLTFANNVATKALASGKPVSTTLKFEGQEAGYTFAATAGKELTFNVTHFDFTDSQGAPEVTLDFYQPHTTSPYTQCSFEANGYCDLTPPAGGTWTAALVPYSQTVGSLTLELN